jgi:hypothetical protein
MRRARRRSFTEAEFKTFLADFLKCRADAQKLLIWALEQHPQDDARRLMMTLSFSIRGLAYSLLGTESMEPDDLAAVLDLIAASIEVTANEVRETGEIDL